MNAFFNKLSGSDKRAVAPEARGAITPIHPSHYTNAARLVGATTELASPPPSASPLLPGQERPSVQDEEGELTVDIYDRGDAIVIQSTVAGVRPEDLDVSIANDLVTIRGKRERGEEVRESSYYYRELFWGIFSRSVILPEEIEDTDAEAVLKHGLLTIKLPKKRRDTVQKVKVKMI